ncbi:MAG: hypothetical protein LAP87_08095 [Acidobacteriia bacterium]|nr:hypothetical protein [Terriglobia bacterium]
MAPPETPPHCLRYILRAPGVAARKDSQAFRCSSLQPPLFFIAVVPHAALP